MHIFRIFVFDKCAVDTIRPIIWLYLGRCNSNTLKQVPSDLFRCLYSSYFSPSLPCRAWYRKRSSWIQFHSGQNWLHEKMKCIGLDGPWSALAGTAEQFMACGIFSWGEAYETQDEELNVELIYALSPVGSPVQFYAFCFWTLTDLSGFEPPGETLLNLQPG